MARKRTIDPGLWSDEGFLEMSDSARLLLLGLISNADDEGRGPASAKTLKAKVFPADTKTGEDVLRLLAEVVAYSHTLVYTREGGFYYALLKWKDYQKVDHPQGSNVPAPHPENIREPFAERSGNVQESFALINQLINKGINEFRGANVQGDPPALGAPPEGGSGSGDSMDKTKEEIFKRAGIDPAIFTGGAK